LGLKTQRTAVGHGEVGGEWLSVPTRHVCDVPEGLLALWHVSLGQARTSDHPSASCSLPVASSVPRCLQRGGVPGSPLQPPARLSKAPPKKQHRPGDAETLGEPQPPWGWEAQPGGGSPASPQLGCRGAPSPP